MLNDADEIRWQWMASEQPKINAKINIEDAGENGRNEVNFITSTKMPSQTHSQPVVHAALSIF